jgi:hypothetical protein
MRRGYSDHQRAEALAVLDANGGALRQTSRDTGIPTSTLKLWRDEGVHPDCAELCTEKKQSLADRLEALAHTLIDALPGKVTDASLQQAATSLGIAVDKMRLLRGEPTSIQESRQELTEDDASDLAAILQQAGDTRTVAVHTGGGSAEAPGARSPGAVH